MKRMSLTEVKALVEEWNAEQVHHDEMYLQHQGDARREARFRDVGPADLMRMWETGTNEKGRALSHFEFGALVERWVVAFGCLPPDEADNDSEASTVTPVPAAEPSPEPDTMLSPQEVVRLTGISLATIKRMVVDGRFPPPYRPSPRRICWPAREVKTLLEQMGGARRAKRH